MKKAKGTRTQGFSIVAYAFTVYAVFVFGCNESLPRPVELVESSVAYELRVKADRIIRDGLADNNPLIKMNAIEVVAATGRVEFMPAVQRLLNDDVMPVRFAAALAMGDTKYQLAKKSVKKLMNDDNENIRIVAAYALAKLGSSEHIGIIRKAITSKDQTVRANAALLLGKLGDKKELKLLYWTLRDEDSQYKVRSQAVESMAMLGDEKAYPKIWAMLISARADDRVIGIRAMGTLGTKQAKDALITMLDDAVLEVRLAAAEQLGTGGGNRGEAVIRNVFKENLVAGMDNERLKRVNVWTALAIGKVATNPLKKYLPKLLKNESKFVRIAAAKAVFQYTATN